MIETIRNQASLVGIYGTDSLTVETTIAETEIVEGLTAVKTASKSLWYGGNMTYTVTIANNTLITFEAPAFSDTLDAKLTLVADSVKVNGTPKSYTFSAQVLSIGLEDIDPSTTAVITFDVTTV